ncbi:protein-glucosylgalactosylhydroxylysine glucosidase [Aedes albopictus]|uniref:Glycoside hydrolase family 65 central catalytic domain-containing protein n=1 Tax=Aedes albopictus TaxID=7160 RepID=A0ABM1Y307_AEDAL|nr:protein-glucosylgalactosylhydroxylysine glucosidase-like [Aedes albopictus]
MDNVMTRMRIVVTDDKVLPDGKGSLSCYYSQLHTAAQAKQLEIRTIQLFSKLSLKRNTNGDRCQNHPTHHRHLTQVDIDSETMFHSTRVAPLVVAILVTIGTTTVCGNDANFLFTANRLPAKAVTPTLANGNIAFVVYGDAVHMNGVYNGQQGLSHRARIPNYANLQMPYCSSSLAEPTGCSYQLDMKNNMFRTVYEDPLGSFRIVHDVYPNRYYDKAIVNKVRIQRLNSQSLITVNLDRREGLPSVDITFGLPQVVLVNDVTYDRVCGKTNVVEDSRYQQYGHDVCVYYPALRQMQLTIDKTAEEFYFFTVFAHSTIEAETELRSMMPSSVESFHFREMERVWERYGITVEGNDNLDRVLRASSFYLSSSLPSTYTNQISSYPFYGLSPSGLGRGGEELMEYQGHSFWDTEIWMYPPILLMDPQNARKLLRYRTVVHQAAVDIAKKNEYDGWQFPWESAFTGTETTPECCPEVVEYQHHITADIAFAARQYFYATEDVEWMRTEGCRLAYETAKFWSSRVEYNNVTDLYDIHRIMGPDEDHHNVSNNPFTNVVAAHNLMFGEFAGCLCEGIVGATREERAQFTEVGKGMTLLHDKEKDFFPQFEGYQQGTLIKQADVVLLGYPLEFQMDNSTKANNLAIYSQVTRSNGPAMTWAMHTIGHLELGQMQEAEQMFTKSYQQYMRAPYNVWSENGDGTDGAGNFITGAGGFLQSVINGYAGVRLRNGEMVITKPLLLPGTSRLYIPEINYLGIKFYLDIKTTDITFGLKHQLNTNLAKITVDGVELSACDSCFVTFKDQVVIRPNRASDFNGCQLKDTKIGIKVADQNAAHMTRLAPALIASVLAILALQKLL